MEGVAIVDVESTQIDQLPQRILMHVLTERGTQPLVSLKLVSGPDDDGSPRFTILLPGGGLSDAAQTL